MKDFLKILTGCLMAFALFAPNARADGTNLTSEQAWSALTNFSLPQPPMAWATNPPTEADLAKFDDERAARAGVLADQARDFYTQFLGHANVSRARVTELQALQMAVHYGATNRVADLDAREEVLSATPTRRRNCAINCGWIKSGASCKRRRQKARTRKR